MPIEENSDHPETIENKNHFLGREEFSLIFLQALVVLLIRYSFVLTSALNIIIKASALWVLEQKGRELSDHAIAGIDENTMAWLISIILPHAIKVADRASQIQQVLGLPERSLTIIIAISLFNNVIWGTLFLTKREQILLKPLGRIKNKLPTIRRSLL